MITNLNKNPHVVTSSRGVDAWGLYAEALRGPINTTDDTLTVDTYVRIFVAGNIVAVYNRPIDAARTIWKPETCKNHANAMTVAKRLLTGDTGVMRGAPILVQLENTDLESLRLRRIPAARYRGNNRHESLFGKIEATSGVAYTAKSFSSISIDAYTTETMTRLGLTSADVDDTEDGDEPY